MQLRVHIQVHLKISNTLINRRLAVTGQTNSKRKSLTLMESGSI